MRMSATSATFSALPAILAIALGLILVPYGSATFGAQASAELLVALIFAIFVAVMVRQAKRPLLLDNLSAAQVLALPALLLTQILIAWTVGLSDGPIVGIERSFSLVTAVVVFFVLVHFAALQRAGTRALVIGLVILLAGQASYAIINLMAGNETLLFAERTEYHHAATGSLVSKNHFAYLMELFLPVCVGFLMSLRVAMLTEPRPRDPRGPQSVIVGVVAALGATALLLSASRMGLLSIAVATGVIFSVAPKARGETPKKTTTWAVAGGIGALVFAYTLAIGPEGTLARVGLVAEDFRTGRLPIWQGTWTMFTARPLLGHGWGTFADVYPAYKAAPTGFFSPHAHNDYLQVAAESGIVGIAAVGLLLTAFVASVRRKIRDCEDPSDRPLRIGLAIAISSVLIHSAADFGLRIPGVGFSFAYVLALYCSSSSKCAASAAPDTKRRRRHGSRRRR